MTEDVVLWRFSTKLRGRGMPCPYKEFLFLPFLHPHMSFPRKRESIFLSPEYNNRQIHLIFFTKKAGFPQPFIEL
jgi:hypothetical protein